MSEHSIVHATFSIERNFDTAPAGVYAAWSGAKAKRKWYVDTPGWRTDLYETDFRVGGVERIKGGAPARDADRAGHVPRCS